MRKIQNSIHPDDDLHYEKMGLVRGEVQPWEDASRVDGTRGCYEWWYFDSHYPDGTVLVLFFYSKMPINVDGPIKPIASMELTLPDGRAYSEEVYADIRESSYAKDICDVRIGDKCYCRGDLKHYEATFEGKTMSAHLVLDGTIEPWRSQTGSIFFGDREEHYFAWLPAVPEGVARAEIEYEGGRLSLCGSGYHDHNWGNISMLKLMHHWYWGRARIGNYKVISSWITAGEKYGFKDHDVFMIARDGKILGDNSNHTLKFLPEDRYIDQHTGKPVYNRVIYEYTTEEGEQFRIIYQRRGDINKTRFVDVLPKPLGLLARLVGFDGGYLRFEGTATVERIEGGEVVERVSEPAVWELMYFGKSAADEKYREKNKK